MLLRRYTKQWGDPAPIVPATRIAPGAHDLLAADATMRNGTHQPAVACRSSAALQSISPDLAVGEADFHVLEEQDHEACIF